MKVFRVFTFSFLFFSLFFLGISDVSATDSECFNGGGLCNVGGCPAGYEDYPGINCDGGVSCCVEEGTVNASPEGASSGLVPCGRNTDNPETAQDETDACTLCHFIVGIKSLIDWGFGILVFVAIAALVISGIMYIVSAGNESMMEKAKGYIKQTLTGFIIVLGAWLIINYTMVLLGTRSDLGISVGGWSDFECRTETYRE